MDFTNESGGGERIERMYPSGRGRVIQVTGQGTHLIEAVQAHGFLQGLEPRQIRDNMALFMEQHKDQKILGGKTWKEQILEGDGEGSSFEQHIAGVRRGQNGGPNEICALERMYDIYISVFQLAQDGSGYYEVKYHHENVREEQAIITLLWKETENHYDAIFFEKWQVYSSSPLRRLETSSPPSPVTRDPRPLVINSLGANQSGPKPGEAFHTLNQLQEFPQPEDEDSPPPLRRLETSPPSPVTRDPRSLIGADQFHESGKRLERKYAWASGRVVQVTGQGIRLMEAIQAHGFLKDMEPRQMWDDSALFFETNQDQKMPGGKTWKEQILEEAAGEGSTFEQYIAGVRRGQNGGQIEIRALQYIYGIFISVFHLNQDGFDGYEAIYYPENVMEEQPVITLLWNTGRAELENHYFLNKPILLILLHVA